MQRLGPATWVRHPRLSEGQGLFRVTSSLVPSGHLAVGSPWTCPRELTFTVGDSPGLSVLAPVMVFPIPGEEGACSTTPASPSPLSEQRQGQPGAVAKTGQPGHRGEVMQWERTWPLSPTDRVCGQPAVSPGAAHFLSLSAPAS